jgi:hypothetical protein
LYQSLLETALHFAFEYSEIKDYLINLLAHDQSEQENLLRFVDMLSFFVTGSGTLRKCTMEVRYTNQIDWEDKDGALAEGGPDQWTLKYGTTTRSRACEDAFSNRQITRLI